MKLERCAALADISPDHRTRVSPRLLHLQPSFRGEARACGRDFGTGPVRVWPGTLRHHSIGGIVYSIALVQSLIGQLLTTWQFDGYVRWLHGAQIPHATLPVVCPFANAARLTGLAAQYEARRDFIIDALAEEFNLKQSLGTTGSWAGLTVLSASAKPRGLAAMSEKFALGQQPYFSLVPPTAGMFLWLKIHFENVRGFKEGDEASLELKLWTKLAEAGVLVGPGYYFATDESPMDAAEGHFRMSFSLATVRLSLCVLMETVADRPYYRTKS